jgi:RNA polymerase sigma-70 factor, ECF subfamily
MMIASAQVSESFSRYRPLLFGIAYRMLGAASDAEDIVQDTFVRWLQSPESSIESPRAYLSQITTRLCIDQLRSARARREVYTGEWLPEPLSTSAADSTLDSVVQRESLSFAFLLLLRRLSPIERAVFILREVFEVDYAEIAGAVGRSGPNCRQILHRAHQRLGEVPQQSSAPSEVRQELAERFQTAIADGDAAALLRLLDTDATFIADHGGKAPPGVRAGLRPVQGSEKVVRGMLGGLKSLPSDFQLEIEELNGKPALTGYVNGHPLGAALFEVLDNRIRTVYLVVNPDKLGDLRRIARER